MIGKAKELGNPECYTPPVMVAERSKTCTAFARSEAGIVGLNPTQNMDV
jgi:hypothetical protein